MIHLVFGSSAGRPSLDGVRQALAELGVATSALGEAERQEAGVGLLAGIIPIPGGVGVVEGGLAFGLVNAGMTEEAALAAVLLYRISVFYLPPVWGYPAFRWLQSNGHL